VLNNQPQGGFITRRPTADVTVADDNYWGDDAPLFQPKPQNGNRRWRGGPYFYPSPLQRGWW
jgi:hypothetical protein